MEPLEHMPKDAQDDCIAQTRNSCSRRRWSKWILEIEGGIQISFPKFCRRKKRFQLCTDNTWSEILYFRAIQGNSGENTVNPSLLDNVLSPDNFFEFVHHVGSVLNMHSISASGLIARGKNHGRYRQTVFFTDVDPMNKKWIDQGQHDLRKPRHAADNKRGKYVKMKDIGLIFVVHKWWDWNSSKQGRVRSFSMTRVRQYALK